MQKTNQDLVGEKCIKNDAGELSITDEAKKHAWKEHYERLLNVEIPITWNQSQVHHLMLPLIWCQALLAK